jgi:hypothetical protein
MREQVSRTASDPNIQRYSLGKIPGTMMQVNMNSANRSEEKIAEAKKP